MKRQISRLANENNRASVVTAIHGLTGCGCRFRNVPPLPPCKPYTMNVGTSSAPKTAKPQTNVAAFVSIRRVPKLHPATHASAAYGSSNGHDMWIWMIHASAAPISPKASGTGIFPTRKMGTASKNPMKKAIDGASRYDGLIRWAESSSVQGSVISQAQTSQVGS